MFTRPHLCDFSPKLFYQVEDIIVLDNFYQPDEAKECLDKISKMTFTSFLNKKHRGIGDDKFLAKMIFSSVVQYLDKSDWIPSSVNHKFRFIKGEAGYFMSDHYDESKIISINEKSFYSVLLYLNDDEDGEIVFNDKNLKFQPKAGRLIIFNQQLLHHSLPSTKEKCFLHSEIFCQRTDTSSITETDEEAVKIYQDAQTLEDEEREKQEEIAFKMSSELEKMVFNL